jgi:hypothetical protein
MEEERINSENNTIVSTRDADPDPYVFGPRASATVSVNDKYGFGSGFGSFHHQAKIVRKTLISTVL